MFYYPNYFLSSYRHAGEICRMALDLLAACGMVVRPDIRPKTIQIKCGIHTGPVVTGNIEQGCEIHSTNLKRLQIW